MTLAARVWAGIGPVRQGMALRVASGILFVAMGGCVKAVSEAVPLGQIVFFRSAVAMLPLVLFLWWRAEFPSGLRTRRPWGHALRSALGAAAMFTSFAAIARLGIAEAVLLSYLSPLFLTLLAVLILGEHLTPTRLVGLALGLAGVLVLTGPELLEGFEDWEGGLDGRRLTGLGLGLATALLTAGALLQIRRLNTTESPGAIAFYFALVCTLAGLATLPFGWVVPHGATLWLLIAAGLFGGLAHICMTLSFRLAEAAALAPLEYLTLIWAVVLDLAIFGTPIGPVFALAFPLLLASAAITGRGEGARPRAAPKD